MALTQATVDKVNKFTRDVNDAAKWYSIPPALIKANIYGESGGDPDADASKNPDGYKSTAYGLMQIIEPTAKSLGLDPALRKIPRASIFAGAKLLRQNLNKYNGRLVYALAAYYCGNKYIDEHIKKLGEDKTIKSNGPVWELPARTPNLGKQPDIPVVVNKKIEIYDAFKADAIKRSS